MRSKSALHRVAVIMRGRSTYEDNIVRGVLDYHRQTGSWRLVTRHDRPFVSFEELDLGEVDGVVGNFREQATIDAVKRRGIAAVNTSNRLGDLALPRVASDEEAVGRLGAEYLLERGFACFAFLGVDDWWLTEGRYEGFRQVIEKQAGRTCHAFSLQRSPRQAGGQTVASWLESLPKPIGIMAVNDTRGRELIQAADEIGLHIPEEVAVLGVDNDEWLTSLINTPLSSIELDGRQIGHRGAHLLDQLMAGEPPPPPCWIAPVGVVTRASTDVVLSDDPLATRAMQFIRDHSPQGITVEDLLDELGVSRKTLEMRLRRATGKTPGQAIAFAQVNRSKAMLSDSSASMGEIAAKCGFARPNHFSTVFKRLTGMTPGQYRQQRSRQ
jgi:LacI family transcriptional regulator